MSSIVACIFIFMFSGGYIPNLFFVVVSIYVVVVCQSPLLVDYFRFTLFVSFFNISMWFIFVFKKIKDIGIIKL